MDNAADVFHAVLGFFFQQLLRNGQPTTIDHAIERFDIKERALGFVFFNAV